MTSEKDKKFAKEITKTIKDNHEKFVDEYNKKLKEEKKEKSLFSGKRGTIFQKLFGKTKFQVSISIIILSYIPSIFFLSEYIWEYFMFSIVLIFLLIIFMKNKHD